MDIKKELGFIMGIPQDWDQDVYLILKEKLLTTGVQSLIKINNHWINKEATLWNILMDYASFHKDEPIIRHCCLRNNLGKLHFFQDERITTTVFLHSKIVWQGELQDLKNEKLEKYLIGLDEDYEKVAFRFKFQAQEGFSEIRKYVEYNNHIMDTEKYLHKIFKKNVVEYKTLEHYSKFNAKILEERSSFWNSTLDWKNPKSIGFVLFDSECVNEYENMTELLFSTYMSNSKVRKMAKEYSQGQTELMKDYYYCLTNDQPLILKCYYFQNYSFFDKFWQTLRLKYLAYFKKTLID